MYMYIFKACLANKRKIKLSVFINYTNLITEREKIEIERVGMYYFQILQIDLYKFDLIFMSTNIKIANVIHKRTKTNT